MKEEIAKKWIEELRSGKHQQTQGRMLRSNDYGEKSYCCLGVLRHHVLNTGDRSDLNTYTLSPTETQMSGIRYTNGEVVTDRVVVSLVTLNDIRGWDFNRIADHIEKNWERL